MAKNTLRNVYGSYILCAQEYGSNRWYAVREGQEQHPINAVWLALTEDRLAELRSEGIFSDGCVRFFSTKRSLLAAINGTAVKVAA
jgi:hypothetical protein